VTEQVAKNGEKYGCMKRGRLEGQEVLRFLCASLRAWENGKITVETNISHRISQPVLHSVCT